MSPLHALLEHDFVVPFSVHSLALNRFREVFATSGVEDHPTETDLELVLKYLDRLWAWKPDDPENVRGDADETPSAFDAASGRSSRTTAPAISSLTYGTTMAVLPPSPLSSRALIAFSRLPDRRMCILIGWRTYSAATNVITDLERLADPIFVGEQSS